MYETPGQSVLSDPENPETASPAVADELDAAADYIEVHGWCQNEMRDWEGHVCLVGAIAYSRALTNSHSLDADECVRVLQTWLGVAITWWNDQPGRTMYEVVDALRLCAKDLREMGL